MSRLRQLAIAAVALAVVLGILAALLASALAAAAIVLPLAGLGWFGTRLRTARLLWTSGGRLPMP